MATMVEDIKKKVKKAVTKKAVVKKEVKKIVGESDQKIALSIEVIEKKAYELFEKRGAKDGSALQDWLEAEAILRSSK